MPTVKEFIVKGNEEGNLLKNPSVESGNYESSRLHCNVSLSTEKHSVSNKNAISRYWILF